MAAMEHIDRVVGQFTEEIGRAVAAVRSEVTSERAAALKELSQLQLAAQQVTSHTPSHSFRDGSHS